jgi:phospholipase D1/2
LKADLYGNLGHPIADVHPGNVAATVFPGQDYNNARIYDFADVDKWEQNKR